MQKYEMPIITDQYCYCVLFAFIFWLGISWCFGTFIGLYDGTWIPKGDPRL